MHATRRNGRSNAAGIGGEGVAGHVQLHQEPAPGGGQPQRDARRAAVLRRCHQRPGRHHQEPPHVIDLSSSSGRDKLSSVRAHARPRPLDLSRHGLAS